MKKRWIVLTILSGLLFLAACGGTSPEPTAIVESEGDVEEVMETAVSDMVMDERQFAPAGRYSFMPVNGYGWEVADGQTFMSNDDGTIMLSVVGVPANDSSAKMIMDDFVNGMATAGSGTLERGNESVIVVDGVEGTAVNLTGDLFGSPAEGQAILVQPTADWAIFALAIGNVSENQARWRESGQPLFMTVMESMEFLDETAVSELLAAGGGESCPVATDPTYGYSEDNPIQVGGDAENDSARATAYLDNLVDPVGIPVTYYLAGSSPYGDTVLSIYEINTPMVKETIKLYIDQYNYSELMAPVGFSCEQAFSISAP